MVIDLDIRIRIDEIGCSITQRKAIRSNGFTVSFYFETGIFELIGFEEKVNIISITKSLTIGNDCRASGNGEYCTRKIFS